MTTLTPEVPTQRREPGLDRSDLRPRPTPGRPLWVIFGSLLLIGAVGWGAYNLIELIAHEEWIENFTVPADDLTVLSIDNDNGWVTVTGTDGDEVRVVAEVSRGLFDTKLSEDVVDGRLEYTSSCPGVDSHWCWVRYTVEAPRDLDVVVNIDNGRTTLSGISGSVTIGSHNGRVELDSLAGPIDVRSNNGRVVGEDLASSTVDVETHNGRVGLRFGTPPDQVTATTNNGRIEVALPSVDDAYAIETATSNGSTNVLVATNPASERRVRLETHNGSIIVRPAN